MAPKTERFEMRLDEETLARVDKWRARQDDVPSRAEAMRRLVELGLTETSDDTVRFSDGEKLLVFMLRDIYKHLKVTESEIDPDFFADVISGGHYWAPKWELQGLFHDDEDDPRELGDVIEVLDMWEAIERGFERLSKKEREKVGKAAEPFGKHVKFPGFDGNNEATFLGIAHFLIEKMDRYERFKGRSLNSHAPSLAMYRRMLSVFGPMRQVLVGGELNATQIASTLKAMEHPG